MPAPRPFSRSSLRFLRLKSAWLLAPPFLLLARPSPGSLAGGVCLAAFGLAVRAVAAGSIHKDRELARTGIYGAIRHPLYLGSFFLGLGLAVAGGSGWIVLFFLVLFFLVYRRTIRVEERELACRFGSVWEAYHRRVPPFLPLPGRRFMPSADSSFRSTLYMRNKEWQAAFGTLAGFVLLWVKMLWLGG